MKTAVGSADDGFDKDKRYSWGNVNHHRTNITHEHIGGMHEPEAMGHSDECPKCQEDWNKRRGYDG